MTRPRIIKTTPAPVRLFQPLPEDLRHALAGIDADDDGIERGLSSEREEGWQDALPELSPSMERRTRVSPPPFAKSARSVSATRPASDDQRLALLPSARPRMSRRHVILVAALQLATLAYAAVATAMLAGAPWP